MMDVAVYGLGEMGRDIATCISAGGSSVVGYDPLVDSVASSNAMRLARSVAEAARSAQVHLIIVKDVGDVEEVLFGEDGVAVNADKDALIVLHTTVPPSKVRTLASRLRTEYDLTLLDAALSRRDGLVAEGSLSLFVGASSDDMTRVLPILRAYADNIVRAGDVGAGMTVKLCNNWLLYCNRHSALQALEVGARLGIGIEVLKDAVAASTGSSWALQHYSEIDENILNGLGAPSVVRSRTRSELGMVEEMVSELGELPSSLVETLKLVDAMESSALREFS